MRRFLSKTLIFLGVFSLVLGTMTSFGSNLSYAEDLEIIGRDLGLVIVPDGEKLFDLQNLNPGDTKTSTLTIKNEYQYPFQLSMRTERISPVPEEEEVDMFEQLIITVEFRGETIHSGPMKDFATSNISLGNFSPNDIRELKATVHLPGPETGNEFQGKGVDVKWIFIATADVPDPPDPVDPPDEPEEPTTPVDPPTEPEDPPVTPEEPPGEEIIDEEPPTDVPDPPEEPEEPEEPKDEVEEVEEEVPKDRPVLPKTGDVPVTLYYGIGGLLLVLGAKLGKKKDE